MAEENNNEVEETRLRDSAMNLGQKILLGGSKLLGKIHVLKIGDEVESYEAVEDSRKRFLLGISMDNSVKSIGKNFVQNSLHLRYVDLSENIDNIPENAFNGCINLGNLNLDKLQKVKYIEQNALAGTKIRNIPVMDSLEYIDKGACQDCKNLRHLNFTENSNIKILDDFAFAGCKRLVNQKNAMFGGIGGKFDLPPKLEVLGAGVFSGCNKVRNITLEKSVLEVRGNPFLSDLDFKDNGKMKLHSRWRNWHSKIEVPGYGPIRAKNFTKMTSRLDGRRIIETNGQYLVQKELDGKYSLMTKEGYEEWKQSQDSIQESIDKITLQQYLTKNFELGNINMKALDKLTLEVNKNKEHEFVFRDGESEIKVNMQDLYEFNARKIEEANYLEQNGIPKNPAYFRPFTIEKDPETGEERKVFTDPYRIEKEKRHPQIFLDGEWVNVSFEEYSDFKIKCFVYDTSMREELSYRLIQDENNKPVYQMNVNDRWIDVASEFEEEYAKNYLREQERLTQEQRLRVAAEEIVEAEPPVVEEVAQAPVIEGGTPQPDSVVVAGPATVIEGQSPDVPESAPENNAVTIDEHGNIVHVPETEELGEGAPVVGEETEVHESVGDQTVQPPAQNQTITVEGFTVNNYPQANITGYENVPGIDTGYTTDQQNLEEDAMVGVTNEEKSVYGFQEIKGRRVYGRIEGDNFIPVSGTEELRTAMDSVRNNFENSNFTPPTKDKTQEAEVALK